MLNQQQNLQYLKLLVHFLSKIFYSYKHTNISMYVIEEFTLYKILFFFPCM